VIWDDEGKLVPIEREIVRGSPDAAYAFLTSQRGAILHEVGHYVAANLDALVCGHLIIRVDGASGGFVPDDPSSDLISADPRRWSLVAASGVLAEYHFCGEARFGAARGDIEAYQAMFGFSPVDQIIARWKQDHLERIAAHAGCIEANFERCVRYCRHSRFLIGDYHVIPSCRLLSPRRRGLSARLDEAVWTYPMKQRSRALQEFLGARAGLVFI
jgi:hypothetical protein